MEGNAAQTSNSVMGVRECVQFRATLSACTRVCESLNVFVLRAFVSECLCACRMWVFVCVCVFVYVCAVCVCRMYDVCCVCVYLMYGSV